MMTTDASPRRRRWPWVVALLVVVGLLVAAWFIADSLARGVVTSAVRSAVIQKANLPQDQPVDVQIEGMVIPQLVDGTFHDVQVSSDNVPVAGTTVDVAVTLKDVEYRGDTAGKMSEGAATMTVSEAALRSLASGIDGIKASTIALKEPDLTVSAPLSIFGTTINIGVALQPSAKAGALVLTPDSFSVGGATMTASDVSKRFGSVADTLTKPRTVCIADRLPAGMKVTDVAVLGSSLVIDYAIDGNLAVDSKLQQKGTCS